MSENSNHFPHLEKGILAQSLGGKMEDGFTPRSATFTRQTKTPPRNTSKEHHKNPIDNQRQQHNTKYKQSGKISSLRNGSEQKNHFVTSD